MAVPCKCVCDAGWSALTSACNRPSLKCMREVKEVKEMESKATLCDAVWRVPNAPDAPSWLHCPWNSSPSAWRAGCNDDSASDANWPSTSTVHAPCDEGSTSRATEPSFRPTARVVQGAFVFWIPVNRTVLQSQALCPQRNGGFQSPQVQDASSGWASARREATCPSGRVTSVRARQRSVPCKSTWAFHGLPPNAARTFK